MNRAYATMLSGGDAYVPGAEALGRSLRASGTAEPMIVMVTPDVPEAARTTLAHQGWIVRAIEPIARPSHGENLLLPRFENVYSKLRAWELTDVEKVVFLDADTVVVQNVDELFERPEIAASPDFLMPDRFNSGVMVLVPNRATFERMLASLESAESYDGGDQGFLNTFFAGWYAMPPEHRLPVGYNLFHFIFQFIHAHPGLRRTLEKEAKIIHYAAQKPWQPAPQLTGGAAIWWSMYYGANPQFGSALRQKIHALEDWTFEHIVGLFVG